MDAKIFKEELQAAKGELQAAETKLQAAEKAAVNAWVNHPTDKIMKGILLKKVESCNELITSKLRSIPSTLRAGGGSVCPRFSSKSPAWS